MATVRSKVYSRSPIHSIKWGLLVSRAGVHDVHEVYNINSTITTLRSLDELT